MSLRAFSCAAFLSLALASTAIAGDWSVAKVSGTVWANTKSHAEKLVAGMALSPGTVVVAMKGSRAVLVNEKDVVTLSPNAIVEIPRRPVLSGLTTILGRKGQIHLNIEKQSQPHFAVNTPFLAVVVKGTRFTVTVNSRLATVSVERGLVEVRDNATGQKADVGAGEQVSSGSNGGLTKVLTENSAESPEATGSGKSKGKGNGNGNGTGNGTGNGNGNGKGNGSGNGNGNGSRN